jgi:hypothetical protein
MSIWLCGRASHALRGMAMLSVTPNIKVGADGMPVTGTLRQTIKGRTLGNGTTAATDPAIFAVLAGWTYNGDANLDGRINFDDYFQINQGFLAHNLVPRHGYWWDDFDCSGVRRGA